MVCDDETDQGATKDAFDALHHVAAKRLSRGKLTVIGRHQRAAGGTQAARRVGPALPRPAGGHRVGRTREDLQGAERRPARFRPARRAAAVRPPSPLAARPEARGLLLRLPPRRPRSHRRRGHRARAPVVRQAGRNPARSTSSAMSTAAPTNWRRCSPGSATSRGRIRRGARRFSSATSWTAGRACWTRSPSCGRCAPTDRPLCVPGNHDVKLLRRLRGKEVRVTHGLATTLAEIEAVPADRREGLIEATIAFLDGLVSHAVLDGGRLVVAPCRHEGGDAGARLVQGARFRPLRRDDRRERRVRPAGAPRLGGGLQGSGTRRVRPHARSRGGMAQPDDERRYRLRLRRQADRPALSRDGTRLDPGGAHLLRTCPPHPGHAARRRRHPRRR